MLLHNVNLHLPIGLRYYTFSLFFMSVSHCFFLSFLSPRRVSHYFVHRYFYLFTRLVSHSLVHSYFSYFLVTSPIPTLTPIFLNSSSSFPFLRSLSSYAFFARVSGLTFCGNLYFSFPTFAVFAFQVTWLCTCSTPVCSALFCLSIIIQIC